MQVTLTSQQVTQLPRVPREMRLKGGRKAATGTFRATASRSRAQGEDEGILQEKTPA